MDATFVVTVFVVLADLCDTFLEKPSSNGFCGHCGQPPIEAEIRRLCSQLS